jgi:murein biosynthesis integral membrane protein MurJ
MSASHRKILTGSAMISGGTLLTRLLGMVREILSAAYFGTGPLLDAFVIAFRVPNLFRRVLGEEMFERAALPPFGRLRAAGRDGDARAFLLRTFALACLAIAVVSVLIWIGAPWLVRILAPGLGESTAESATGLARLLVPFLGLIGLATFAGAVLLFSDRKLLYGIAPAAMNVVVVTSLVFLHEHFAIRALAYAWILGAGAYLLVQLPASWRVVRGLDKEQSDEEPPVGATVREGGRILTSSVITKGVEVVDGVVASLVGPGAISSLYYSYRLVHLPFSVLSLAVTRSLAPELSRLRGKRDAEGFAKLLHFGLELNLLALAPATLFFMVFASETVSILYQRGSFGVESVEATSLAFFYYALAILPMGLVGLLFRVYSALEDNRIPVAASVVGAAANIILDLLLYRTPLAQGGIALASAVALSLQTVVLLAALGRFGVRLRWRPLIGTLVRASLALALFAGVVFTLRAVVPVEGSFLERLLGLAAIAIPSFAIYGVIVMTLRRRAVPRGGRILLAGGGTGGHVYPALAIHRILDRQGLVTKTLYLGVKGRAEERIVPRHDIPLSFVSSAPFAGTSPIARLRSLAVVARGTVESMGHLFRFRPKLVVATGGYVSAPVIVAAFLLKPILGLKILMHEANLMPGVLNKVASLLADVVFVSFRESAYFIWSNRCVFSGYPVRDVYLEEGRNGDRHHFRSRLGLEDDSRLVLIYGGSLGSRSVNRAIASIASRLPDLENTLIVHGIGMNRSAEYDAVEDTRERLLESLGDRFNSETLVGTDERGRIFYRGYPYLHDLVEYQRHADLVVCRAGAGSLAEGLALGSAMLTVPKRGLPGDHQELNAIGLAERGAAEVLFERRDLETGIDRVDADELFAKIESLLGSPERRRELADGARRFSDRECEQRLVETVEAVIARGDIDYIPEVVEPPFVRFQRQFDALVQHLDRTEPGSLYYRLYNIKVEEFLRSSHPMTVNKGIKLVGALRREDLYPWIAERYAGSQGFLRRNTLSALAKAATFHPCFVAVLLHGLTDNYYEARREAVSFFCRFEKDFLDIEDRESAQRIRRLVLELLARRSESFEVRAEAIRAAVRLLDERSFLKAMEPFVHATEIRYREALLDAVDHGLSEGLLTDHLHVHQLVDRILITTSDFTPAFRIRERFQRVARRLEDGR